MSMGWSERQDTVRLARTRQPLLHTSAAAEATYTSANPDEIQLKVRERYGGLPWRFRHDTDGFRL